MTRSSRTAVLTGLILSNYVWAADAKLGCPIQGEVVQWIADVCMATIGTDDEIAASDCIAEQVPRTFKNACKAKEHYKRALCSLAISNGSLRGPIERCVNDPAFSGSTVRKGGVGG